MSDDEIEEQEEPEGEPAGNRWRRPLIIAGVVLLVLLAGWVGVRTAQALLKSRGNLARAVGRPLQVKIAQVTSRDITEVIGGTTLAEGFQQIQVISVVSEGRVLTVKTDLGRLVKPGDVMLEFDVNVFQQAVDRARFAVQSAQASLKKLEAERDTRLAQLTAAVASAKERLAAARTTEDTTHKTYDRTLAIYQKQVVALAELELAQVKWDDAKSALALAVTDLLTAENALKNEPLVIQALIDQARAVLGIALLDLAQAEKDLKNTTVPSPVAGVVSVRKVNPGEWIKGSQLLFSIDLVQPIYATAQIEQERSPYVAVNQEAEVVFDAFPTRIQRGTIYKIDPSIDPTTRTFKAYVLLQNPKLELRPGMAAFTRVKSDRHVLLVPRTAVLNPTGAPTIDASVFVVEDGKATSRKVKLGKPEGPGRVEVFAGLSEGEWVVVHGNKDLVAGDRVNAEKVVEKDAKKGEAR